MAEEGRQVVVPPRPQLSIWSIGQGFEGTASDWTEYVVWLVSFIALVWFVWSRNVMALPETDPQEFLDQAADEPGNVKED
mmetsp:Transcript_44852/g.100787  ORF Transcript_44852/g.100787 Transcript_44852/m.100787 type:complete len:80 (+) Transcript_44852:95-334(+)